MRTYHGQLLRQVDQERARLLSRRRLLAGGTGLAAGAAALSIPIPGGGYGLPSAVAQQATPAASPFASDVDVLNYALTLEHLEHAFYRDGVPQFAFGADGFGNDIGAWLAAIGEHERAHVETLTQVIAGLGGEPVAEATYDFGYADAQSFLTTAAALENTGVMAYDGAGQYLEDRGLLTAAGAIVAVEARHAAYLNLITGMEPASGAFEQAETPAEILEITRPFMTR